MVIATAARWRIGCACMAIDPIVALCRFYCHGSRMDPCMAVTFNYSSPRAQKARAGNVFKASILNLLVLLVWVLIVGGITLVIFGFAIGWLLIGLAAWPYMIMKWAKSELKSIAASEIKTSQVDDVLTSSILAHIPKNPSPLDIANALTASRQGLFYGIRFGLTPNFLQQIASSEQSDANAVWEDAMHIRERLGTHELTAGMLVYAITKQLPDYDSILAHNHIELEDIIEGIHWQNHLNDLIREHRKPRRTGGIARDWSFGYTPLLNRFGRNVSVQVANGGSFSVDLEGHNDAIDQLIETFSTGGRQNNALIGSMGVGKTTIVEAFAERLLDASSNIPDNLKFRQVIMLDSTSLLSAAPGRGEVEDLIMQIFGEAYAAKNVILCLDDAQLFFEEGIGSVDLSNVLLPIIEAGNLRLILTMDEQKFLQISQRNTAVANALNRISVREASKEETVRIMQDQLILTEYSRKVTYTYQSISEAYRLGERYVHDLAMPGRALKLLNAAAGFSEDGLVTINSVQQAIERTLDVKIGVASGEAEREKLLNLEDLIHKRMINQTRAVTVVSDALRRARAGVRNQDRPIGTFLFLGPTGVGKTELAKALADVYFGGEQKMIRLDLNEYAQSSDAARLIADGADDASSLTAQAMKQPFSVVLLDEIEKAHPNVLNTLLQLLDEGILRDVKNREVSFRDAIIIATSNAGADRIREYIDRGYKLEQFEQQFMDELISSNQFKPEFLNRFDEIVTFKPLEKPELLQVVDLMIQSVNKNLALQKITVEVELAAKELLVERGYDPRLGARPMRRVIQRVVENNVAKGILSGLVKAGTVVTISAAQVEDSVSKNDQVKAIELDAGQGSNFSN